ncbi:MAG: right-handed parallel beta-helix repeat-containing protein, partial [Thermoguttaceae bacterium]
MAAALVTDNTVHDCGLGQTNGAGIDLYYGTATQNVVYDNLMGIESEGGQVTDNRVYDNATVGIQSNWSTVQGNTVYSNPVGIEGGNGESITNNLIYANANQGILVDNATQGGVQILNNTIYQVVGNAVQVQDSSQDVQLRNNILWAQAGYDISVASDSQVGFQSDYNLFYVSGSGKLGSWQGQDLLTLPDWFYETGNDMYSQFGDPQFVNSAGLDGVLGYSTANIGSPLSIDYTSSSGFTLTGSWSSQNGYPSTPAGDGSATAAWTFSGLTLGATYEVTTSWPGNNGNLAYDAPFTVLDGGQIVGYQRVDEGSTSSAVLGAFQVTGTTLTVMLSNNAYSTIVADAVTLQQIVGDHGGDDNFQLQSSSPAVAAGDPASYAFEEPTPNAGRIDLGAYGNTPQTSLSAAQVVQVLSPSGLEKYQVGQQVTINWQTVGLTAQRPVALIAAGSGSGVDNFGPDQFQTSSGSSDNTITGTVDTSGVSDPAPEVVYQSYAEAAYGVGNALSYHLAVPDGVYTIRLDFAEPDDYTNVGDRVFDIALQGTTVQSAYDIAADASGDLMATAKTYTITVSGGEGINLSLTNDTANPAVLSGIEVYAANPQGMASPTVNLEYSADDGSTWTTIATGLTMDQYGQGSYDWSIPTTLTPGSQYLVRVVSNNGLHAQGTSPSPFLIANNGHNYYVSAAGNNANSGKTPDQPMANLAALLAAYTFEPSDVISVAAGTYNLLRNVVLTPQDSGVTIIGPSGGTAVLNRGNVNPQRYTVEMDGAANVTIENLEITGGYDGIHASSGADATGMTISDNVITGNYQDGVYIDTGNDHVTISGNTVFGIPDDTTYDAQAIGIYLASNYGTISGNTVYDNGQTGIEVWNAHDDLINGNKVYANPTGIDVDSSVSTGAGRVTVSGNTVYDNIAWGIIATGALVTGNTVYGQSAANGEGINASGSEVAGNTVFTNVTGIDASSSSSVHDNVLYNNSSAALLVTDFAAIHANKIYSNAVGIEGWSYYRGEIDDNLLYANTTTAILLSQANGATIINNTIYQPSGDAIDIERGSSNIELRNNILYALNGYTIFVAPDSESGFNSDYNDLFAGSAANAHVGSWNGDIQDSLAAWQAASGGDTNSLSADPQFVDPAGADNLLGYGLVNGAYVNGGADDNFYLKAGSPCINRGYSWGVPPTDITGAARDDDPGTPNQGSPDYFAQSTSNSIYAAGTLGTAQNWHGSDTCYQLTLPFAFTFYGNTYTTVQVSTSGFLQFAGNDNPGDNAPSAAKLLNDVRIAPLWMNINTNGPGNDIYVNTSVSGQVTVRWQATNAADGSQVDFAVVLFSDGSFRFDYGPENTNVGSAIIGISAGNGDNYQIASYTGQSSLTDATSLAYTLQPGFVDIGAYEFLGSSLNTTPPAITATTPSVVGGSGTTTAPFDQFQLTLSEPLNPIDANAPAAFQLLSLRGSGNTVYTLVPQYTPGSTTLTLSIVLPGGGELPSG